MDYKSFFKNIAQIKMTNGERAIALLWFYNTCDENNTLSVNDVCKHIENFGYGKQNPTRLKNYFRRDRRLVKKNENSWDIKTTALCELDNKYSTLLNVRPIKNSESVICTELFNNARPYIKKVVQQLNVSYDYCLFDCCAVMCRRLLETLIIEAYENHNYDKEIKNNDGNYFMFSGLLSQIEKNNILNLGRGAIQGLKSFKKLGDLSAHNRRFNARKPDIDQIKDGLRVACEELLHLANQGPKL